MAAAASKRAPIARQARSVRAILRHASRQRARLRTAQHKAPTVALSRTVAAGAGSPTSAVEASSRSDLIGPENLGLAACSSCVRGRQRLRFGEADLPLTPRIEPRGMREMKQHSKSTLHGKKVAILAGDGF